MPRLFLAIPMDDRIRARLVEIQARLGAVGSDVRWVSPENLHLTIASLGDQTEAQLPDILSLAEHVAECTQAFRIELYGGSAFPKKGPPKTLWVGVRAGAVSWAELAHRAEKTFAVFDAPPGNGLTPHITLGRVRGDQHRDELRAALQREAKTECGDQAAGSLELMESTLDAEGAIYRSRGRWQFRAATPSPQP